MRYRPKIGDRFTFKGPNILGKIVTSDRIYECEYSNAIGCVATNNGVSLHFKHNLPSTKFQYVKVR
jgi:hypothetical protein